MFQPGAWTKLQQFSLWAGGATLVNMKAKVILQSLEELTGEAWLFSPSESSQGFYATRMGSLFSLLFPWGP